MIPLATQPACYNLVTQLVDLAIIAIVSAECDGADAKLHGEFLKQFISGCQQTGRNRRCIKGV